MTLSPAEKRNRGPAEKRGKKPPKRKTLHYPLDAINWNDELDKVIFFGRKFSSNERGSLMNCSIDMTTDLVSQLEFRLLDPGFTHMGKGLFRKGIPVKYEDMLLDIASVEISSENGKPAVSVRCRPRIVRKLKDRTGAKVMKNASATDFVRAECQAIGAKLVAQPCKKRKQVARDKTREKGSRVPPSSWTTFQRLADEEGYAMFESMDTIFFGKPTWIARHMQRKSPVLVQWQGKKPFYHPLTIPRCSRLEDSSTSRADVEVVVPRNRAREFRPGKVMRLEGIPSFEGFYLITSVNYSLLTSDPITVRATIPVDPPKSGDDDDSGPRTTSSLRYLLEHVGFKGDKVDLAVKMAMAQTRANADYWEKINVNAQWGPHVGLYAIRSLNRPEDFSGLDKRRKRKQLLNAVYNAKFVYDLTDGGKDWSMFPSYKNGSYKKFKKKDYQVQGWSIKLPKPKKPGGDNDGGSSPTGRKSAAAFVATALQQTGDAYVYGAEAPISNPNPSAFDCSELVQWAAGRVGVPFVDGSSAQIAACKSISVEQAIRTRGALLWHPGHIAISLGNGRTIEAANPGFGVGSLNAAGRFTRGGLIPGMRYGS